MEDQKIRSDTTKNPVVDEHLMDILLVMDKEEKTIKAVTDVDKDGNVKTTKADSENQNEFLHVGHNSDAWDVMMTSIKNFYSQAKDPTRFEFFTVPVNAFKESVKLFKELIKDKRSPAADEFTEKYRLDTTKTESAKQENDKNESTMAKKEQTAEKQQVQDPASGNKYRFNESMINWKQLENFGISREYLKDKGMLDGMLKGYKSTQTVPISMNFGAAVLRTDARLSFQQSQKGPVVLAIHGIRQEPQLQRPFFGHIFSEEDKKNLLESGNMGRAVDLKDRNGQFHSSLISIDKLTNEVVSCRVDNLFIPNEVSGVKLTDIEKAELKDGKAIYIEGMTAKSGKEFDATIQINADRRGIEYIFNNEQQQSKQIFGGVELSPQQQKDYNEGKAIFVEDMKRKDGELFSSFIKKDEATDKPAFTRYNPDTPEGNREIYIPKEIGGVKLTGDERDTLRRGEPIFLDGMVNRKGEEFSSYVKIDTESGIPSYAKKPDDFAQKTNFKIPAEVWGVTLNVQQRAQLQDGKAVLVEGMKGFDGKEFSSYLKVNNSQGKLDYYNENPDRPKAAQKNKNNDDTAQSQKSSEEKKPKKSTGPKM